MKKTLILLTFVMAGFLFSSNMIAQNSDPENPEKTKKNLEHVDDFSEHCKPDWSGYEEMSPDISTRPLLYPKEKTSLEKEKGTKDQEACCKKTPENKNVLKRVK